MHELLPPWPLLTAFLLASVILAITPGPGVFCIVTRSLAQGRRSGLASVAGVAFGNPGNAIGASLGLAAVFAVSSVAFAIVKCAGALYLVYLGIQAVSRPQSNIQAEFPNPTQPLRIFRDGFLVALLNPKTAIFFTAFLPQFMGTTTVPMLQSVVLCTLFVAIAAITDAIYALAASAIASALARAKGYRALGRYLTGTAFIGLGAFTALSGSRHAR
jgi:threonine/homoserine/homoserine lactone efflux protein